MCRDGAAAGGWTKVSVTQLVSRGHECRLITTRFSLKLEGTSSATQIAGSACQCGDARNRSVYAGRLSRHVRPFGKPLVKGEKIKATLSFERAGQVAVEFPVEGLGAPGPEPTAGGSMGGMKM